MLKGALVCTGHLRNYKQFFDKFLQNLVFPNDLDVFFSFERNSSLKVRYKSSLADSPKDSSDDEEFLREKLGPRIKMIHWSNEDSEFKKFTDDRAQQANWRVQRRYKHNVNWYINQFSHVEYLFNMCKDQLASYDYIMRFRIDVCVEEPVPLLQLLTDHPLQKGEVYINPDFPHMVKEIWVCEPQTFGDLICGFSQNYGSYIPKDSEQYSDFYVPEAQLGQFLRDKTFRDFITYVLDAQFRYTDGSLYESQETVFITFRPGSNFTQKNDLTLRGFPCDTSDQEVLKFGQQDSSKFHPIELKRWQQLKKEAEVTPSPSVFMTSMTTDISYDTYLTALIVVTVLLGVVIVLWCLDRYRPKTATTTTNIIDIGPVIQK